MENQNPESSDGKDEESELELLKKDNESFKAQIEELKKANDKLKDDYINFINGHTSKPEPPTENAADAFDKYCAERFK